MGQSNSLGLSFSIFQVRVPELDIQPALSTGCCRSDDPSVQMGAPWESLPGRPGFRSLLLGWVPQKQNLGQDFWWSSQEKGLKEAGQGREELSRVGSRPDHEECYGSTCTRS